ncbi:MAG TPA: outer membrane beta-barrel protein [Terriglobales bacterium]|nr:outer membrane beta-barrel protein [Terriglobales bacterium]
MKKILVMLGLLVILASPAYAIKGVGIGIRGGLVSDYKNPGLDNSTFNLDLKQMPMFGGHVVLGFIPIIELEGSAEMAWKKKSFDIEGNTGDLTLRDFSLNATVKYKFPFPVIKPYIGAGLGWHWLTYSVSLSSGSSINMPVDENRLGYHGLVGLALKLPALPLEFFAEGRYTHIMTKQEKFDTKASHYTTLLGGVTLGF